MPPGSINGTAVTERRRIQRDWVGHGVQALILLVGIGVPLFYWGSSVNTALATLQSHDEGARREIDGLKGINGRINLLGLRVDREDRDQTEMRSNMTTVAGQIIELNKQLARFDTLLSDIRENLNAKKR